MFFATSDKYRGQITMKARSILGAVGLAAMVAGCAPPEIKQDPFENKTEDNITRADYFDGSFDISREEPKLSFKHNIAMNYDYLDMHTSDGHFIITDYKFDGVTDQFGMDFGAGMNMHFRYQFGKERLFETANKMLKDTKTELGL